MTPKAQETKENIDKSDFIKILKFCTSTDTIKKMKRQPTEWEKIVANHIFNKVCYLEYIKGSCNSKANKLNNST